MKKSIENIKGDFEFEVSHGATDASHFAKKGIPTAMMMPRGANIHGKDEYAEIDSLEIVYDILNDFVDKNLNN